jgi:hypothetical protein
MEQRVLLSDFTGGEVSPRVDARSDLKKYGTALRRSENFILSQQGGAILRLGSKHLGASLSSGSSPVPEVLFIPWRSGDPSAPEILFELTGTTVRGWRNDALISVGGLPYSITLPVSVSDDVQYTQRGNLLAISSAEHPTFLIRVNAVDDWELVLVPVATWPKRIFLDDSAPPRQSSSFDLTFTGFTNGNTFSMQLNGRDLKENRRVSIVPGAGVTRTIASPRTITFSTDTATTTNNLRVALESSQLVGDSSEVAVSHITGTTYRVVFSGSLGGTVLTAKPSVESDTRVISIVQNADGDSGEELAWGYPTVVTHSGVYYQCISPHVSTATAPASLPLLWLPLLGAPAWEAVQPSRAWSSSGVSYGLGNRGFPRACAFHEQRLILGGSPSAPQAFWGSFIGDPKVFTLGVEDDEALSRDIDAQDAPAIRWMTSQQGLIIGTSAGVYRASGQVTLTPADVSIEPFSADRCSTIQPQVVGNEVLFVSQDRTQLLAFRRNEQVGPYEVSDLTALAEHLGRYRIRRVVYCRQPQPVIYVLTDEPGLLLAVTYNRQYEMVAFSRLTIDGHIDTISTLFSDATGDDLYLMVRRGDRSGVEKISHPVTNAPVENPSLSDTVHLDGWVTRTDTAGTVSGLRHLLGKTVTVLNSAGTVQGTATVALGGTPSAETPVAVDNAGFESGLTDWNTVSGFVATSAVARTGAAAGAVGAGSFFGTSYSEIRSDPIAVTPGRTYRVALYWRHVTSGAGCAPLIVRIRDAGGAQVGGAVVGPQPDNTVSWTKAEVTFNTPANAATITIGAIAGSVDARVQVNIDDVEMGWTELTDGVITATGTNLIIGQGFTGTLKPMEPEVLTRSGSIIGTKKKFDELSVRLYQSALPKVNGDRPSDYDQAGGAYRANPQTLRSGDFDVNTQGWDDGQIEITQDLPHRTEITGLYGPMKVNR